MKNGRAAAAPGSVSAPDTPAPTPATSSAPSCTTVDTSPSPSLARTSTASSSGSTPPPPSPSTSSVSETEVNDSSASWSPVPPLNSVTPPPPVPAPSARVRARQRLDDIAAKIESGEYVCVQNTTRVKGQRPEAEGDAQFNLWTEFLIVVHKTTKLRVVAVQCNSCKKIFSHDSSKTGTTSLVSHARNACPGKRLKDAPYKELTADAKSLFVDKVAEFCASTMSSMNHMTGDALVQLVQTALDIGFHAGGRVDARELVPKDTSTIADRIDAQADVAREEVMKRVKEAINDKRCRCTTDMWTDDENHFNFIDVTAHFSNSNCSGQESHFICMAKFPVAMEKNGTNIRNAIFREMTDLGVSAEQFSNIEWVTDRGANVKKALEDNDRADCAAHLINTTVKSTLTLTHLELRQKALSGNPAVLEKLKKVEEVARVVRSVGERVKGKKGKKASEPPLPVDFDATKLSQTISLPRPHLSSYGGMLQSVIAHKRKVS
ncbi:hypothetical protein ONE63_005171 [Megalurothrips usitatus]|uniref:BED-type domain-containing protein n=1 Tax=Megalurothrips usitatus TaxID=439358 RepID=A0AAV7Y0U1_9NEOP|nr:hypothetical protein ONE63_005171 [Megalurothrips usitatus]